MRGEQNIKLNGKNCVLVFDWDAISLLEKKFGFDGVEQALESNEIAKLADVMECGLARHHPDIKASDIFDWSPSIVDCKKAVNQALAYAYFGDELPVESKDVKKKTKAVSLLGLISLLLLLALIWKHFGG